MITRRFCASVARCALRDQTSLAQNFPTRCEDGDELACLPTSRPRQELHSHSSRRVKVTKVLVCNQRSGPASRVLRSGLCGTSLCGTIGYKVSTARGFSRVRGRFREDLFIQWQSMRPAGLVLCAAGDGCSGLRHRCTEFGIQQRMV